MRGRLLTPLLSFCLTALLILPWGALQVRALDDLRNLLFDVYQRYEPRSYTPETPVRVVGVDEASLATYGQWPWSRKRISEILERLRELGAAAIVVDFIFAEADRASNKVFIENLPTPRLRDEISKLLKDTKDNDDLLAHAIASTPSILSAALSESGATSIDVKAGLVAAGDDPKLFLTRFPAIIGSLPSFTTAATGVGLTNWMLDRDRIVRRIPLLARLNDLIVPAISIEAVRVAQGADAIIIRSSNASGEDAFGATTGINAIRVGNISIQTGPSAIIRPHYRYYDPSEDISAKDLLEGRITLDQISGRIIFVGATSVGIGDIAATPLQPSVPGVALQSQITEAILEGASLSRPDWAWGLELSCVIFLIIFVTAIVARLTPMISVAISATLVIAILFVGYESFSRQRILFDASYPAISIVAAYLLSSLIQWRNEIYSRDNIRNAFGKFVSPVVVDRLAEHPELLKLGGETKELSVMFSDLRNFTKLSEGLTAQQLTCFMNDYLTPMTDIILECEGTVDKYIGDAILAFWNAPIDIEDHGRKSVLAALRMRSALEKFNRDQQSKNDTATGSWERLHFAIGLNRGPCSVGNMGSSRRFDYSILGDTVNFTSRLEGSSKHFQTDIVASSSIHSSAPEMAWLDLGLITVVGKSQPQRVYALAGDAKLAYSPKFKYWANIHNEMISRFEAKKYPESICIAEYLMGEIGDDWQSFYRNYSRKIREICNDKDTGGPAAWRLTSK